MDGNVNSINWFEIPAADINRAKKFYETVFDIKMESQNMMGMEMAFFPWDPGNGKVAGALVQSDMHIPSGQGVKIYLNGNPDLAVPLANVEQTGYMAFIVDSEGNTIGFHSQH